MMSKYPATALGWIWITVFFVGIEGAADPQELPPGLQHLTPLVADEQALEQAIRDFDKAQTALAQKEAAEIKNDPDKEINPEINESALAKMRLVRQAYELGLDHYTNNARLHNYYGELLYDWFGEYAAALKEWNTALSLNVKYSNPNNNLGLHFVHTGDYRMGFQYLKEALRLEPKNPDYLYNTAQIYLIHWPQVQEIYGWKPKKIYRYAMKCSRNAAEHSPGDYELAVDYAVNFFAGERFSTKVCWKKAAQAWTAARSLARDEVETFYTWLNEARAWIEARNEEKATACLNEAIKLRPDSDAAKRLLERVQAGELKKKPSEKKK